VNILAVLDLGESTAQPECATPVDRACSHTDRCVAAVPGGLNPAIKQNLGCAGSKLHPVHSRMGIEVLWALNDCDVLLGCVRHQLEEVVGSGDEVGVEDGDEVARGVLVSES
jgi:hypothetical protein